MKSIGILVVAAIFALPATVRGGGPTSAPAAESSVRVATATEDLELVAALDGPRLTLYLDRFATNAPVVGAQVELESGRLKAVATQVAPGQYAVDGEHFAHPGRYPLVISVEAEALVDLLTATLEVPQPAVIAAPTRPWLALALGGGTAALLLVGAGFVAGRHRKRVLSTEGRSQ